MTKIMVSFLCILTFLNAESINQEYENNENFQSEIIDESDIETETETESKVDCLILEDENSIICKFETSRKIDDENIIMQWVDPHGDVSRSREMMIPAGHGSIYDYRYIKGRFAGTWTFKVISGEMVYKTQFELN